MLPALGKSLGRRAGILARYAAAASFLAYATPLPAAEAPIPPPEPQTSFEARAEAAALARETLRRIGADTDLAEWTRTVTERALSSAAGADAEGAQEALPAERRAGALAEKNSSGRSDTARVLIFMSLAVPAPSWRQWAAEAARAGAPLVLRGPSQAGLQATVAEVGRRLGGFEAGVAVDPRLFRLFDVSRVPAVVVVPGGVPACARSGCTDEDPPPHDRVTGNVGLKAALAAEGAAGRAVAQKHLERLGGDL